MAKIKKYFRIALLLLVLVAALTILANYTVTSATNKFISDDVSSLPTCKTALLLGTSKSLGARDNPYFVNRIRAAAELIHSGKVKYIIVSGDNGRESYNEPEDMKNALIELGVADSLIYLDYAGFRTFDSVVRAKEIFSQDTFIVVSQEFHNERAVYLARHYGIEAYGYNAREAKVSIDSQVKLRELFARVKMFIDILTGKEPKFLGEKISVGH